MGVYFTYPMMGIVAGTIVSFILAFLWVLLLSPVMKLVK